MDMDMVKTMVLIAYSAVGIMEWIKSGMDIFGRPKAERGIKVILPWAALPVVSFGAAALFDGGLIAILSRGEMAWATAQLAYPLIIKLPAEFINLLKTKAAGSIGKGSDESVA